MLIDWFIRCVEVLLRGQGLLCRWIGTLNTTSERISKATIQIKHIPSQVNPIISAPYPFNRHFPTVSLISGAAGGGKDWILWRFLTWLCALTQTLFYSDWEEAFPNQVSSMSVLGPYFFTHFNEGGSNSDNPCWSQLRLTLWENQENIRNEM